MAAGLIEERHQELRVSASTDPEALAGAIARSVHGDQQIRLRALGPNACYNAIRSVTAANSLLSRSGITLQIRPAEKPATGNEGDPMMAMIFFLCVSH